MLIIFFGVCAPKFHSQKLMTPTNVQANVKLFYCTAERAKEPEKFLSANIV
jgi:hypothetical protein